MCVITVSTCPTRGCGNCPRVADPESCSRKAENPVNNIPCRRCHSRVTDNRAPSFDPIRDAAARPPSRTSDRPASRGNAGPAPRGNAGPAPLANAGPAPPAQAGPSTQPQPQSATVDMNVILFWAQNAPTSRGPESRVDRLIKAIHTWGLHPNPLPYETLDSFVKRQKKDLKRPETKAQLIEEYRQWYKDTDNNLRPWETRPKDKSARDPEIGDDDFRSTRLKP
ncbi:hypothetical protein LTR37_020601 [Vermiconidia calcicola]|uniref:Uncharacterized protein n=1 Tax=Vermiconidia calcicola TaxID=1690605 RepID=A0ACC3MB10_9PEZI|nr:hypothetical protein LTR37_020601 [Vermiconidia calcicola]